MNRSKWPIAVAVALLAAAGCKKQEPHTEELFQAQSLGLGDLETGDLAGAETQFKKVIDFAPREPLGHANLGLTYLRGSRYADAEKELGKARELDPANADIGLMMARLYAATDRSTQARSTLHDLARNAPTNAHVSYALAELDADSAAVSPSVAERYDKELRAALAQAPANLAVRLQLVDVLVRRGQADSALRELEEAARLGPAIPKEAKPSLDSITQLLHAGNVAQARSPLDRFLQLMQTTPAYQGALAQVKWVEGPLAGRPVLSFTPKFMSTLRRASGGARAAPEHVRFVDNTSDAGLPEGVVAAAAAPVIAMGDYDGDGTDDLFAGGRLYHVKGGRFGDVTERSGISVPGATYATFADVDNDGRLDVFVIGGDRRGHLFHNEGGGKFSDVSAKAAIGDLGGGTRATFVDIDHDGDLDLVVVGGPAAQIWRNNGDGTFTEVAQAMGIAGANAAAGVTRDVAVADFDGDGRTDLLIVSDKGKPALYHNDGGRHFTDVAPASGITTDGAQAVTVGDFNNDGFLDVFLAGANGGESSLWLNDGRGKFRRDTRSSSALQALRGMTVHAVTTLDYDNDGWLDVAVAGTTADGKRGVALLHNDGDGRFSDRSSLLPPSVQSAEALIANDVDGDGDLDLVVSGPRGVQLLRNDGGNANLSMQVQLTGLRTGSGKNNDFGIGSRIEVRAADLYQTRVATSRVTHFGLGPHLKADVVRVEWTNGLPQTVYFPGTDQDVIENEVLKGSCAFLYTWDGSRFRFVTDVMWRSALGMPLGLMAGGKATAYAPAGASQEYLRIPGSDLQPRNSKYTLQLTEELWETAYADKIDLLAVDHPDSIDVFVDERFVPPGPVQLRLFRIAHKQAPLSAVDDHGRDVLPALLALDDHYVDNLVPLQYQGLVEPHDLVMDLGPSAGGDSTYLFLRGWIYPTDASINVALSQQSQLAPMMPSLSVRDPHGAWKVVNPNLSFPSGKNKTMVLNLAGIFPTKDHHVRIRTNLQIYWDQAFTGRDVPGSDIVMNELKPTSADLHYRGYSRTYRKGGRYGPWWFDYDSVSKADPWRTIDGAFTRFGDVLPLLKSSDEMYVIMAPGDEATLEFDAGSAARVPAGWTRDFLLYSDGWIKDSDLNTAYGTTVEPLPFHAIKSYPYAPGEAYPTDAAHEQYRRAYNTRVISRTGVANR